MSGNNKKVNVKMSMDLVRHLQEYLNQIDLEGDELVIIEENEEENEEESKRTKRTSTTRR